tara:strand:- start:1087 stop:2061 length:975 start_codon:yes stop_codon:yes gene_type:complete
MEENNRHYNMIEILKQIEHFDTNEMSRIKELDERLQFLESLLPKLPTATHYDATLSSTIVRYVREQLNDAIHNSSSSNIVSPFKKSTTISNKSSSLLTHENIKKLEQQQNEERQYESKKDITTTIKKQSSNYDKMTLSSLQQKATPPSSFKTTTLNNINKSLHHNMKNRKVEISIMKYHRYNNELKIPVNVKFNVNGKVLYTTKNPSVVDISMPTKTIRGENDVLYYYKWNYESFTISRKTLEVVIQSNSQAFITITIVPILGNNNNSMHKMIGQAKLYLANIIETLNSPTSTKIKLNVMHHNDNKNGEEDRDILEIELRELLF